MMTSDVRVKDAMELAAASPDPAVRQLALRYQAMRLEIEALDSFFAVYSGSKPLGPLAVEPVAIETKPINGVVRANGTTRPSVAKALRAILLEKGPLDLDSLHEEYVRRNPDDAGRTRDQVRLGVARHPERFKRLSTEDRRIGLIDAQGHALVA